MIDKLSRIKNLVEDEYGIFVDPEEYPDVDDIILINEGRKKGMGRGNNARKMYASVCSVVQQYPSGFLLQDIKKDYQKKFISISEFRTRQFLWRKVSEDEIREVMNDMNEMIGAR